MGIRGVASVIGTLSQDDGGRKSMSGSRFDASKGRLRELESGRETRASAGVRI